MTTRYYYDFFKGLLGFLLVFCAQPSLANEIDPRSETVVSIDRDMRGRAIIRDLFTTTNPSDGVIALLPLITSSGYKEVLVWVPPQAPRAHWDSPIELLELPVEKEKLIRRQDDFSLATPKSSVRYQWKAGGETGYMIAQGGKLALWIKGATKPVVFNRASFDGTQENLSKSPWEVLRHRMHDEMWFKATRRVSLLNTGPARNPTSGLEDYLNQLDPRSNYTIVSLTNDHKESHLTKEETRQIEGFQHFVLVAENDKRTHLPAFEKSNLVGLRPNGTHQVFNGKGLAQLRTAFNPDGDPVEHVGFQITPTKSYYIEKSIFEDLVADQGKRFSRLFGNENWQLLTNFSQTYVYLKTSDGGTTLGEFNDWTVSLFLSNKSQAEQLANQSLQIATRQLPHGFIDIMKGRTQLKPIRCSKLFEIKE